MSKVSKLSDLEVQVLREYLLADFEQFSRFCFLILTGTKLIHVDYYHILFTSIQRLIDQECTRMIINIPPRAGKTLIVSQFLPLYGWARNPSAQTILTGFNSDVLAECSGYIRTIMSDPDFQRVFPDVVIDNNKKSVERLGTMSAGVLHAIPTTGKMTGKGCGTLLEDFAGFMSIDDVIKPDDANSPTERGKINSRYTNTLVSRLATEKTPLVIIMQRLHADDLCGYLMKGNTNDHFAWLSIPGIISKEGVDEKGKFKPRTGSAEWYQEQIDRFGYTNVTPILYDLNRPDEDYDEEGDSSFWAIRKSIATLKGLREKDPYTFYSQYMGMPIGKGTQALQASDLYTYLEVETNLIRYTFITADTAATTKTYSDFSVACYWGVTKNNELLLLDIVIGKWEVPDLIVEMRNFWNKHNVFNPSAPTMKPTAFYMEDKSSGLFLNQQFLKDGTVNVRPVPRDGVASNDKFTRFLNTIPYFNSGRIRIPKNHEHTEYIKRELLGQSEFGSSTGHDDVADNFSDAVAIAFAEQQMNYEAWS